MEYEQFENSDLLKFYYSLNPENKIDQNYQDSMYADILKFANKTAPAEKLGKDGIEVIYSDDSLLVSGISFADDAVLWYDGYFADEWDDGVFTYSEDEDITPVALDIMKKGSVIISPEMIIGEKLDYDIVFKVFDGNMSGRIGEISFGPDIKMIDCQMRDFELTLNIDCGILTKASIVAVAMRE